MKERRDVHICSLIVVFWGYKSVLVSDLCFFCYFMVKSESEMGNLKYIENEIVLK